jgi:hypothetical protein
MKNIAGMALMVPTMLSAMAFAQRPADQNATADNSESTRITVRGCIRSERQNYILIADKTGIVYALQGVGHKLQPFLRKEVELTGDVRAGSVKTGVRPEKAGSNPSDTVHGVDGVPLQVGDIEKNIRVIAKHCTAADAK